MKLSFSGRPRTPVIMVDSMWNVSTLNVSGSKEVMEVLKNFNLQKLDLQNIAQYSAANMPFPAFITTIHFFHTIHPVYGSMWLAREVISLTLVQHSSLLCMHDCETHLESDNERSS